MLEKAEEQLDTEEPMEIHQYKFIEMRLRMQRMESEDFVHKTVTYYQLQNDVLLYYCILRQIFKD